ncbi:MAG: nucleotidyltransferase domain-containing protein [Candidatus Korobacteraceae bacterium]|jgi:predicted nucleotidyltransferase
MKKPESKLQELVSRLQQACGENLMSVVLYGSAAREDFHEQFSDVNVLVVLQHLEPASFAAISAVLKWWSHEEKLRPPMIMTLEELRESADVFAIELLDIQSSHKTLYGQDLVTSIDIPMNLHRVEVEHELRTTSLRLRHHLLLSPDNEDELRAVLAKSITSVLTLFRHSLIALGEDPPPANPQLLEKAGQVFGFEVQPLRSILELRGEGRKSENVRELYHAYMSAIQRVAHELDARVPKRHLRNAP